MDQPDDDMTELQFEQTLAYGIEQGTIVACLDGDGQVRFFHGAVAPAERSRLTVREVATRLEWTWWFQQN